MSKEKDPWYKGKVGGYSYVPYNDNDDQEGGDWFASAMERVDYSKGYSASSRFSKYGLSWSSETDEHRRLAAALKEAARTVNVVRQRFGVGKDQALKVAWSDGTKGNNTDRSSLVRLSPDIVSKASNKPEWTADQQNDALMGDALLGAGMKKTMEPSTLGLHASSKEGLEKKITEAVWQAAETDYTRRNVCSDFRGYAPYFKAGIEYWTAPGAKQALESKLADGNPTAKNAAELWAWNCLHPESPVVVPAPYADAMRYANKKAIAANGEKSSDKRYQTWQSIGRKLAKMFPDDGKEEEQPPPTAPGKGQGQGHQAPNKGINPSLFGQVVTNNVDPNLANNVIDVKDGSGTNPDTAIRTKTSEQKIWLTEKDQINHAAGTYAMIRTLAEPLVRQLKSRLKFRAERKSEMQPDYRSGEVDEFALIKIGIDRKDDRIFCKREDVGLPNVAFTLVIDESGSMNAGVKNPFSNGRYTAGRRCDVAKLLATTLQMALSSYEGIHLAVLGHTSGSECSVRHYLTPENNNPAAMGVIAGRNGTDEAAAIACAARNARAWFGKRVTKNVILSLSDGGTNEQECLRQCENAKGLGIEVYGIGIGDAYDNAAGERLYGPGKFAITGNPMDAITIIGSFVSRVAQRGR